MELNLISDIQLKEEYKRRFTLPVGAMLCDSNSAADHLRQFITDPARESFVVVFLNGNNCIITTEELFQGTLTTAAVYPREIVRRVLENQAAAILLAHNHPSGNLNPSKDDLNITRKIKEACATIDVAVHDHVIIAGSDSYSLADHGLI